MKITLEAEAGKIEIETMIIWEPDMRKLLDLMANTYMALTKTKHPSVQLKDKEDK